MNIFNKKNEGKTQQSARTEEEPLNNSIGFLDPTFEVVSARIKDEPLNKSVPASALIKALAQQRRDLEVKVLDLERENAVLRDDIAALKEYHSKAMAEKPDRKSITKAAAAVMQVQAQLGKKMGAILELAEAVKEFNKLFAEFMPEKELMSTEEPTQEEVDYLNSL